MNALPSLRSLSDPATRCKFIFGQEMKACPKCKGYNIGFSFLFKFEFKGRKFEDRIALPHAAGFDERDAVEMAEYAHDRFLNTVKKLVKA